MNKLPFDLEPNFQQAELYKVLNMALELMHGSNDAISQQIAEQTIETLITAWAASQPHTEH